MDDATTPLLAVNHGLDTVGLRCLLIQHFSSAWGDRTAEFALYLYLILYYKDTLLPSSILGFSTTITSILWSRWAGSLVDKYPKLGLVRIGIIVQKLSALSAYAACALMLNPRRASDPLQYSSSTPSFIRPLFGLLLVSACTLSLSNTCISIAVERDWVTTITHGQASDSSSQQQQQQQLAKVNTYLRQINLLCKLCAPLFVSFLTVKLDVDQSRFTSVYILAALTPLSMVFELIWIGIVYRRFPALGLEQARKDLERRRQGRQSDRRSESPLAGLAIPTRLFKRVIDILTNNMQDWKELIRLPIFYSSMSISLLYLTVLSFDGIMVSYLKTLSFSDDFIAEMRGVCVITGLIGTALARPLERKVGSVRAGNWSIWSMVLCLIPVLITFYMFVPRAPVPPGHPVLGLVGALLLFGGMALSRIGLWSFDLIQTKQLQVALTSHPKRNTLTALQYTMQSIADLIKFILTMILWQPSQFRWAATVSFVSVSTGAVVYVVYVKKERGHVLHLPESVGMNWVRKVL